MTADDWTRRALAEALAAAGVSVSDERGRAHAIHLPALVAGLAPRLAAAIEAHAQDAVREALAGGLEGCHIDDGTIAVFEDTLRNARLVDGVVTWAGQYVNDVHLLLRALRVQQMQLALMKNDNEGYQLGLERGRAAARRYHLFAGADFYPEPGLGDYKGSFATAEEAQAALPANVNWPSHGYSWGVIARPGADGDLTAVLLGDKKGWRVPKEGRTLP